MLSCAKVTPGGGTASSGQSEADSSMRERAGYHLPRFAGTWDNRCEPDSNYVLYMAVHQVAMASSPHRRKSAVAYLPNVVAVKMGTTKGS